MSYNPIGTVKQDLRIELNFETGQWKKQTQAVAKDLDQLNQRFKTTANSTEKATKKGQSFGRAMQFIVGLGIAGYMKNTALEIDRVSNRMKFATDSVEDFNQAMSLSADTANELGLALVPTQRGLATLQASAKGTSLAGKGIEELFKGISQASGALSLTADETNSVFLAFSQIISKGKVQAEELRSQIGERLPGAMKLAEKAMGVTGAELDAMLQSGTLMADDLLPKLAKEFQKTFGEQALKNTTSLTAQLNKLENSIKIISAEAFQWAENTFRVLEGYNKIAEAIEAGAIAEKSSQRFNENLLKSTKEIVAQNSIKLKQGEIDKEQFNKNIKDQITYFKKEFDFQKASIEQKKELSKLSSLQFTGESRGGRAREVILDVTNEYLNSVSKLRIAQRKADEEAIANTKLKEKELSDLAKTNAELLLAEGTRFDLQKEAVANLERTETFNKNLLKWAEERGEEEKKQSQQRVKELRTEQNAIKEKIRLLKQAQTVDDANQVNFLQAITSGSNQDIRLEIEARTRALGGTAGDVDIAQRNAQELEEQTRLLQNINDKLDVERA